MARLRTEPAKHKAAGPPPTRPGKRLQNYGKSPFFMGQLTISMAMFNSYLDITRG